MAQEFLHSPWPASMCIFPNVSRFSALDCVDVALRPIECYYAKLG